MGTRWFDNTHPGLRRFWHPIAAVSELSGPGPHPVRLLGEDFVLAGLEHARGAVSTAGWSLLPATCPHRLAPLTAGRIEDGRLRCGYHGWCFDATGRCVDIPALGEGATPPPSAHLAAAEFVEVRYGIVWAALDDPLLPIPEVAEWDDPHHGRAPMPVQHWNASAAQMTDNFLDVAHFPFTHLGTIGNPNEREVGEIEIARSPWSFDATYTHTARSIEQQASAGASVTDAEVVERVMRFRCWAPHHLKLHIEYGPDGDLILYFFHQPVDVETTALYCLILAENIADGRMTAQQQIDFQLEVAREDRSLLEQLAVKAIPLDPGAEVHTRADRTTIELRRLLADIDALARSEP